MTTDHIVGFSQKDWPGMIPSGSNMGSPELGTQLGVKKEPSDSVFWPRKFQSGIQVSAKNKDV